MQYKEQPFGRMSEVNLDLHAFSLLIKISIITGWVIPDDKDFKNIIVDQFKRKMVESYASLNVQEVEYAIRNYGTTVKDWGKSINLSLIDQAIEPYLQKRAEIRKLEEGVIKPMQLIEQTEPLEPEKWIELVKETYLKTKLTGLIPAPIYDLLETEINMCLDDKKKLKAQVESRLMNEATQQGLKAIKDFKDLKNRKPKDYEILVRNECKKQAVANYFTLQNNIDNF